jgi:hypothetical protein
MRNYETVYLTPLVSDSGRVTMLTKHEGRITGAEMRYLKKMHGENKKR